MPSLPYPVVTLLALTLLLARALFPVSQRHRGTLYFLSACILLITISMLRWEYNTVLLRNIQSCLAMILPPVAWYSFISVAHTNSRRYLSQLLAPFTVALCIKLAWPSLTDWLLVLLFAGYGCGLLNIARRGKHLLTSCRKDDLKQTRKMAYLSGFFLCLSAITDMLITFDFNMTGGKLAPVLVVASQTLLLPFIGIAILAAGKCGEQANTTKDIVPSRPLPAEGDASVTFNKLDEMVRESQIYLNPDLTLALLARKTGIPARQLSGSVNAVIQKNVSQWINGFRIERAKELLLSTTMPVTEIMLESGFTTKSNFNREFQRIIGASPTVFRQQERDISKTHSETH